MTIILLLARIAKGMNTSQNANSTGAPISLGSFHRCQNLKDNLEASLLKSKCSFPENMNVKLSTVKEELVWLNLYQAVSTQALSHYRAWQNWIASLSLLARLNTTAKLFPLVHTRKHLWKKYSAMKLSEVHHALDFQHISTCAGLNKRRRWKWQHVNMTSSNTSSSIAWREIQLRKKQQVCGARSLLKTPWQLFATMSGPGFTPSTNLRQLFSAQCTTGQVFKT